MNNEYDEPSIDGSDEEESDEESDEESNEKSDEESGASPYYKLFNTGDEYKNGDTPLLGRLDYKAIGEHFEIQPNQLTIIKESIGRGYFSDVHMGMLSLSTGSILVAVKTQQTKSGSINAMESENIQRLQREALRDELHIFAHLQSSSAGGHENVLKLVGAITTIREDFCLLTEYCECGSMDRFLQNKWKNGEFEDELISEVTEKETVWKVQRDPSWGENYQLRRDSGLITTSDLLWFALQIARAMQFLTEKNIIHRDVALRNVLLKSDFTLKVADFGLSRKLKESDGAYYVWNGRTALPIRYIAPESLKSGRFTIASEFWSFGVVVWELFTFAEKQPYSIEFENYENHAQFREFLVERLSSGHRLSIPNNVPKLTSSRLPGIKEGRLHSSITSDPLFTSLIFVITLKSLVLINIFLF